MEQLMLLEAHRFHMWNVYDIFPGTSGQTFHQLSNPRVQRSAGGGSGGVPFGQWGCGKISLLFGAESAGFEHQALPPVQSLHLSEEAQPPPLWAQVQGKMTGTIYTSPSCYTEEQQSIRHFAAIFSEIQEIKLHTQLTYPIY